MSWKVASFVFLPMVVNLRMKPHCSSSCSAFEKSALSVYLLQIYKNISISRGNVSIFNGFPRLIGVFCDFYPNMDEFPLSISYNYSCISATMKSILSRLTQTVSGTDKELFNEQELNQFASFYLDKWDENTSEDVVAESFVDYFPVFPALPST